MNIKEEKNMSLQEVLEKAGDDFNYFLGYLKEIGLKESIKKTQELQFGVNLTPKKELKTKNQFLEVLENFEKTLKKYEMNYDDVDEDDDFQIEKIESNNNAIDEINSFLSEIRRKLRFIEYLD